ncbi:hypothetical protein KIW84_074650 [Lathyrus oleraceus]|uniref:Uncharacterized protein n=1 Tax=Pisum sativum TaxID=3888 RepID=A0A9D4VTD7_PEA|nr:hypothetical protein KIW84_074650 [Pisum sativum]
MKFGSLAKDCNLQRIEEPVQDEGDILKFCEESGLLVALDETVDKIQENPLKKLLKFTHPGIVAVVIKPSVVDGFENAEWAHQHGKMVVVSSAFESSLSLSAYTQFSIYLEVQRLSTFKLLDVKATPSVAHGLGSYRWLKEDITLGPLLIGRNPRSGLHDASRTSNKLNHFSVAVTEDEVLAVTNFATAVSQGLEGAGKETEPKKDSKPLLETSQKGYLAALSASSYSYVSLLKHFLPIINPGGSSISLTYIASERIIPGYGGGMSSTKVALESDTRVLAFEAGRKRKIRKDLSAEEVGNAAAFLSSPLASTITGTVLYVDNGLNAMGVGVDSPIFSDLNLPKEQH